MKTSRQILAEVINITDWLEQDRDTPWEDRLSREQRIATDSNRSGHSSFQRVYQWWELIRQDPSPALDLGKEVADLFYLTGWIVATFGFLTGIGVTSALLYYDGSQPINVLMLLGWLIVLPFVFFIISLLLPYLRSNHPITKLNPGSWILSFLARNHTALKSFFTQSHTEYAKDQLLRWRLMLYSQQFGIALAIAAIVTLVVRVTFTDLAFGWSTTLSINSGEITPWIQTLALPWEHWFTDAVPSASLIEQSHYYRLDTNSRQTSAETLTQWWQYIAMCLIVYGIGFRLLTWLIIQIKYRHTLKNLLLQHPEVTALLDRLDQARSIDRRSVPMITASAETPELKAPQEPKSSDLVISWNGASPVSSSSIITVSSESDLSQQLSTAKHIIVYTKSWEPPLLEFKDFIQTILQQSSPQSSIRVVPVSASDQPADPTDIAIWRSAVESIQQPRVYL